MLLREEYIAALAHDHRVVRNNALEMIVQCNACGLDATRQALQAIQGHGLFEAFVFQNNLLELPIERQEAEQLLDLLSTRKHSIVPHLAIQWLIRKTPVDFLRERQEDILRLAKEYESAFSKNFVPDFLKERFRLDRTPLPGLLAELDLLAAETSMDSCSMADTLVELLGDHPEFRGELESRADSWLARTINLDSEDDPDDKNFWTVAIGVHIARKLRLARTIPALVKLLAWDADYMSEWVADALVEMNSLETLETWGVPYPDLEWHERLYLSGTCEHICEPGVDAFLERLLEKETEPELEERLMCALSMQPTDPATKRCARYYRKNLDNPEALVIAENLFTRHTILGLDHPDLDLWRRESERSHDRFAKSFQREINFAFVSDESDDEDFSLPAFIPPPTEPAVPIIASAVPGRNDPCLCGSGKKYKKCCLPTGA